MPTRKYSGSLLFGRNVACLSSPLVRPQNPLRKSELIVARMILFPFLIYDTFVERVTNYHVLLAAEGVGVAFIAITFPLITISW